MQVKRTRVSSGLGLALHRSDEPCRRGFIWCEATPLSLDQGRPEKGHSANTEAANRRKSCPENVIHETSAQSPFWLFLKHSPGCCYTVISLRVNVLKLPKGQDH